MADFGTELIRGFIVHRYKNFILDVKIADNRIVPVFCPDDDSGAGFYKEGTEVFVTRLKGRSKLHYELQLANPGGGVVMVNPRYNREMFEQAWEQGLLPEFSDYAELCPILHTEQLSHADYELTNAAGDKHFVYLTDVYNKRGAYAVFPAAVNFFELEMFEELRKLREKGYKTTVFMIFLKY